VWPTQAGRARTGVLVVAIVVPVPVPVDEGFVGVPVSMPLCVQ